MCETTKWLKLGYRLEAWYIGLQTEHVNYLPLNLKSVYFLFQQDQVIQLQNYNLAETFVVCMLLFMCAIVMFVERWSIFDQFIISCILTCSHMRTCTSSLPCMHVHCSVNIYWTLLIYHILKNDADCSALTQHSHTTSMLLANLPKTLTIVGLRFNLCTRSISYILRKLQGCIVVISKSPPLHLRTHP